MREGKAIPREATAEAAADEARRLDRDLIIQPDAIAVIRRNAGYHPVGAGATWRRFWRLPCGLLFFIPVSGMAAGARLGASGQAHQGGRRRALSALTFPGPNFPRPSHTVLHICPGRGTSGMRAYGRDRERQGPGSGRRAGRTGRGRRGDDGAISVPVTAAPVAGGGTGQRRGEAAGISRAVPVFRRCSKRLMYHHSGCPRGGLEPLNR
jgi:hypothetical protein